MLIIDDEPMLARLFRASLEPECEVTYNVSDVYAPECDGGVRWDDPAIGIDWPLPAGTRPHGLGIGADGKTIWYTGKLSGRIGRVHPEVLGKTLPLNGAGVCGAALADLGLPLELLRGFALLARTAGLIGQLAEELRHPVANDIFLSVDGNNRSVDPDPWAPGREEA